MKKKSIREIMEEINGKTPGKIKEMDTEKVESISPIPDLIPAAEVRARITINSKEAVNNIIGLLNSVLKYEEIRSLDESVKMPADLAIILQAKLYPVADGSRIKRAREENGILIHLASNGDVYLKLSFKKIEEYNQKIDMEVANATKTVNEELQKAEDIREANCRVYFESYMAREKFAAIAEKAGYDVSRIADKVLMVDAEED